MIFSFFYSPTNTAYAAENVSCRCSESPDQMAEHPLGPFKPTLPFPFTIAGNTPTQSEKDQCVQLCADKKYDQGEIVYSNKSKGAWEQITDYVSGITNPLVDPATYLKDAISKGFYTVINLLLVIILQFLGLLLSLAMVLFAWLADVKNLTSVLANPGVYFGWKTVRDLLNISFILILLFTAFAIIFQIDKYNKKTNILTLVIMALLINFSFPITRAIIDVSNVLMYTIIKNTSGGTNALGILTGYSGIQNIISSSGAANSQSMIYLIAAIVFVFIFMITMLSLSILLLIRIIALAILIIFSPIAFVPLPGNNYGGEWWKNLFRWCFFGPIMMFMIFIAVQIMSYMGKHMIDMQQLAKAQSIDNNLVGNMAYFTIPIVILWIGMGTAQKMGVEGAAKVTAWADRTVKKVTGVKFATGAYKAYQTRRQEAQKSGWANRLGARVGSFQDRVYQGFKIPYTEKRLGSRDAGIRYQRDQADRIKKESERNDMPNMDTIDLRTLGTKGNKFEQAAAKLELANRQQSAGATSQADLDSVRNTFGETSQVFRQLNAKVKAFDPVAAFSHVDPATRNTRYDDFINSSAFDLKKINAHSLTDTNFVERLFENKSISAKDITDLREDSSKRTAFDTSLTTLATAHTNAADDMDQRINMAHFANSGRITNPAFAAHIFNNMDKDSAREIDSSAIAGRLDILAQNVKSNIYKEIISNIKDVNVAMDINEFMLAGATPGLGANASSVHNIATRDSFLQNFHR